MNEILQEIWKLVSLVQNDNYTLEHKKGRKRKLFWLAVAKPVSYS